MKKLALVFLAAFLFSCEKNMNDVRPFNEGDKTNFRQLDNNVTIVADPDDDTIDDPILDP